MDNNLSVLDRVCRTCLKDVKSEEEQLISIFLSIQDLSISRNQISYYDMLKTILPPNLISNNDAHPKNICCLCVQQVRALFVFRKNATKSHEILTKRIEEQAAKFDAANNLDDFLDNIESNVDVNDTSLGETLTNSLIFQDVEDSFSNTPSEDFDASKSGSVKRKSNKDTAKKKKSIDIAGFENLVWDGKNLDDGLIVKIDNRTNNMLGVHTCETCRRIFCTRGAFLTHDFDCVNECEDCQVKFNDASKLKKHFSENHKNFDEPYQSEIYTKDEFAEKFIKNIAADKTKISCLHCKLKFDKKNLKLHIFGSHAREKYFKCSFCSESFYIQCARSQHMAKQHSDQYRCTASGCKSQFSKYDNLMRHGMSAHKVQLKVKKSNLESKDPVIESMKFVKVRDENPKPNLGGRKPCAKKRTQPSENRQKTQKSIDPGSSGDLTFAELKQKYFELKGFDCFCKICKDTFLSGTATTHAKNKHATTFPYLCAFCDKGFHYINQRNIHMQRKHPKELYCHSCNQEFMKPKLYAEHMKKSHKKVVKVTNKEIDVPMDKLKFTSDLKLPENCDENESDCELVGFVHSVAPAAPVIKKEELIIKDEIAMEEFLEEIENYDIDDMTNEEEADLEENFVDGLNQQNGNHDEENQDDEVEIEIGHVTFENFMIKFISTLDDGHFRCELCSLRLFGDENVKRHILEEHAVSKFTFCELCDEGFNSENQRLEHMQELHSGKYECPLCNCQFTRGVIFQDHMKEDHDQTLELAQRDIKEDLPIEKILFRSTSWQIGASQNVPFVPVVPVNNEEYREEDNEGLTDYNDNLNENEEKDSDEQLSKDIDYDVFLCDACDFSSPRRDLMDNHFKKSHPLEFKCGQCGFNSGSYMVLKHHIIQRHPDKVASEFSQYHKCPRCFLSFIKIDSLKSHIKHRHRNKTSIPNHCGACSMTMKNDKTFKKHCENRFHKNNAGLMKEEMSRFETDKRKAIDTGKSVDNENLVDEVEMEKTSEDAASLNENSIHTSDDESEPEQEVSTRTEASTSDHDNRPKNTPITPSGAKRSRVSENPRIDNFFRPLKKTKLDESPRME